ncbi:MAG: hypothetical protein LBS93_08770, partial [Synergistaceae bacterium]|nr:hypothetical protein [Synergistaceae bacterium]
MMFFRVLIFLCSVPFAVWPLSPSFAAGVRGISPDVTLSLDDCVSVALERRPSLTEARSGVMSQASRVGQAAADSRMQVRAAPSYGYSRSEGSGGGGGVINTDFTLSQTIFD